jgi:hypothetical protein
VFSCGFFTLASNIFIFLTMQMYPQGRMSHHFREMKVGDYMSVKGPKVTLQPEHVFFCIVHIHNAMLILSLIVSLTWFVPLGSFQVPSRTSESFWYVSWWIRHYSDVPGKHKFKIQSSKFSIAFYGVWCYKPVFSGLYQQSFFAHRLLEQFLRTLMTKRRFI